MSDDTIDAGGLFDFFRRWRQRRRTFRAAAEQHREVLMQQLRQQYPEVSEFVIRDFYSDHPGLASVATQTILRIANERKEEARLRRIIREELARHG